LFPLEFGEDDMVLLSVSANGSVKAWDIKEKMFPEQRPQF
jgi:hypothetical protein